jgi:hypothetical protein
VGIANQDILLRFRDGTIYQVVSTDPTGYYVFHEVFPWFKFLVAEVDFARFYATGLTAIVDAGGVIPTHNGWDMPSDNKRNPQEQFDINSDPIINPNTGNNFSRNELATFSGEILLEAMQLFNDQSNRIDWGKDLYQPGENGGIAGIVYYSTTRAEDDPRFAAAEEWEPGVARVQIVLYQDSDGDGIIDDLNGDGGPTLADVDNYPFGWADGGAMGAEDQKRNGSGNLFNPGDAIQIATTDAWDDNLPEGCSPSGFGRRTDCAEGMQTWNQIVPGVFDGGFAIVTYFPGGMVNTNNEADGLPPGTYIVEAVAPPGLEQAKEEDKNVDFGEAFTPSTQLLPPVSVGDLRIIPDELTLFPGIDAPFAGELRPLPDRKQVILSDLQNAAVEFFLFSKAPKGARVIGLAADDLTNSFDPDSPTYGEKHGLSWLPIAFRGYENEEISRVYTDEFGAYNALVPSTFTINLPTPSGVGPRMLKVCINDPGPIPDPANPGQFIIDPFFKPQYATQCYNFDFWPGRIAYLDTPVIPVGAFVGEKDYPIDCEFPDGTPLIYSVAGPQGGPYISAANQTITIQSVGSMSVTNPDFNSAAPGSSPTIIRDYSFGSVPGSVTVNGAELTGLTWNADTITATIPASLIITSPSTVFDTDFAAGQEGFIYADDALRGTSEPVYADGSYLPAGGLSGGALSVNIGGIDSTTIADMSGAWSKTITFDSSVGITVMVKYKLTQSPNYESHEYSEILLDVDGSLYGASGNSYIARISGDGEGGSNVTTGWQTFESSLIGLSVGNHTITIGAYNNQKTSLVEFTELLIDQVNVTEHSGASGLLLVTRGDNNETTPLGITLTMGPTGEVVHVTDGQSIQQAIDRASSGALILVEPGSYDEMVIVYKNVKLQGSGAFSTIINAMPFIPSTKLNDWREKMTALVSAGDVNLLPGQDIEFIFEEGAGVTVITKIGEFGTEPRARIDGFNITGSTSGGGIFVNAYGSYLDIGNNRIINNLGSFGGGIRIGQRLTSVDTNNDNIRIHHNHITQNTGLKGGGGITIFAGADNYEITDNFICGNFTTVHGGGIDHEGLSQGGIIKDNCILFNEAFFGQIVAGGGGGGIFIGGSQQAGTLTPGSGSVDIVSNLIQGNLARSGDGGAIYAFLVNGQDVMDSPDNADPWHEVNIFNNIVVNNVTAGAGAICLQDAAKVNIINNTIENNDCTATGADAFMGGNVNSTPQPGGVVARVHGQGLGKQITVGPQREFSEFSNPLLADNIIYQNRSFYYDPALFGVDGGGVTPNTRDPYWDLAVLPPTEPLFMEPEYCLLTALSDSTGADYNNNNNIADDPTVVSSYFNTISTAAEPTEGGNLVDITFHPLTKTGDYHLNSGSPAIDTAGGDYIEQFTALELDHDTQPRQASVNPDRGADETNFLPAGTILAYTFDTDESSFTYVDDAFRGTGKPAYASGTYVSAGGVTGGALKVNLAGIDGANISGMSGGWRKTVNFATPEDITLSFYYKLTQSPNYEVDEYSEALVMVDGTLYGAGGKDYLAKLSGDGEGGPTETTGWVKYQTSLGTLAAGDHIIIVGAHNNKKTSAVETTDMLIDDIVLSAPYQQAPTIAVVTATPDRISDDQTCQLYVAPTGTGPFTYSWTANPGEGSFNDMTVANPVYTPPDVSTPAIFTLTVEVSNATDTVSDTIDIEVIENMAPVVVFTSALPEILYDAGGTGTVQLSVNADDYDSGPSAITYSWSIQTKTGSRGSLTNFKTADPTYTTPGDVVGTEIFTVEIQVSDGLDTATSTIDITVDEGYPADAPQAGIYSQRPADTDPTDSDGDGDPFNDNVYVHVTAGDGFINMADGRLMYMFGFYDVTDIDDDQVFEAGTLAAELPGPTIVVNEGQKLFLTLTNVGMVVRPDLFDPHTIHFHGFPQAAPLFDGVPTNSFSINMGASLTYFYNVVEPGTYVWHCHVEATEHMQMGMLANIYVLPKQNNKADGFKLKGFTHKTGNKYVYNDGDGSTYYDVEYPIQIHEFDPDFHDASLLVQPLPFANMNDRYPMLNGRGYPDTVNTDVLYNTASDEGFTDNPSQPINSLITATKGQKILLRLTSLSTTQYHTLTIPGIPMRVVGTGARLLRGPSEKDLSYETNSINIGGGDAIDVILDTTDIEPGTYFLYDANLNFLSNYTEDYGGMMTEIRIAAP